jgi:hypothetical protein
VRSNRSLLVAVFVVVGGVTEACADDSQVQRDFEAVQRMGTLSAFTAFAYLYPDRSVSLAAPRLDVDPSVSSRGRYPVTSPNYGDAYFMRRHLPLQSPSPRQR